MSESDFYASLFGATYSTYIARPLLGRPIGRTVWGGDPKRYYESMNAIAEVPEGGTIVDCPCGAGPALRALPGNASVRYIGADLSPSMLRRARKQIGRRGLENAELVRADATEIPLPESSADLFLSFWGLHCFDDPGGALAEAARIVKPEGRLVGSSLVAGRDSLRQRLLVRAHFGDFGRVATQPEIEAWLGAAGFKLASTGRSGPMLFFEASPAPSVDPGREG